MTTESQTRPQPLIRKANLHDVPAMHALIKHWADQRQMLPRTIDQLCNRVRTFWVAEEDGRVIGCAALRIYTPELSEICSLAIAEGQQGRGLGQSLVNACLQEAKDLGGSRVFALTYQIAFFERLGFAVTGMENLSEKVWADCNSCPFLDNCNETAMIRPV